VAKAHVAAAERGRTGERYLLGGADASLLELVKTIGELAGKPVPGKASPAWLLKAVAAAGELAALFTGKEPRLTREAATMATRTLFCDCSKAVRELGFQTVALRAMAGDCYAWMKQEGKLD
jgi:nucleoside-diphosphate-sugar epimerase